MTTAHALKKRTEKMKYFERKIKTVSIMLTMNCLGDFSRVKSRSTTIHKPTTHPLNNHTTREK